MLGGLISLITAAASSCADANTKLRERVEGVVEALVAMREVVRLVAKIASSITIVKIGWT